MYYTPLGVVETLTGLGSDVAYEVDTPLGWGSTASELVNTFQEWGKCPQFVGMLWAKAPCPAGYLLHCTCL